MVVLPLPIIDALFTVVELAHSISQSISLVTLITSSYLVFLDNVIFRGVDHE